MPTVDQPGKAPIRLSPYEGVYPSRVVFTIGDEVTNTITVGMQLQSGGQELYSPGMVFAYLSDNADGSTIAATAPSGGWAIGSDGLLIPIVANKAANFVSESNGSIDVVITETGADTFYVAVVTPDGMLHVSDAVTFV